jgi:hypothetical protein
MANIWRLFLLIDQIPATWLAHVFGCEGVHRLESRRRHSPSGRQSAKGGAKFTKRLANFGLSTLNVGTLEDSRPSPWEDSWPVQDHAWNRVGRVAKKFANQETLPVGSDIVGAEGTADAPCWYLEQRYG